MPHRSGRAHSQAVRETLPGQFGPLCQGGHHFELGQVGSGWPQSRQ